MDVYKLDDNRMLCWDDFLIEKMEGAEITMHKPIRKNKVLSMDKSWEGNHCGYDCLVKVEDKYRFYYRADDIKYMPDGEVISSGAFFCVAESSDGKNFRRKNINKHAYNGVKQNNIFFCQDRDNFSIYYDENPACPPQEKFKALSMGGKEDGGPHGLYMFVSEDGIDFRLKGRLDIPGSFDSFNIMFWDKEAELYRFFYRSEYHTEGYEIKFDIVKKERGIFRTIHTSTSKDLVHFEHLGELNYGEGNYPIQLYTNQIVKYYRAKDMFIGFPTRYIDRFEEAENYRQMPLAEFHDILQKHHGRAGTVVTDCSMITSRDGYHFKKWDEAFLTAGIEDAGNWFYGDCYTCYGLYETESDTEGAPNEISFISNKHDKFKATDFYRYTVRLDGFFSWYAKFCGGEILTKPFTFKGSELEINFSSSALGDIVITVCDENGNEIEGYKSMKTFGDSVKRIVKFKKDLKDLEDKAIRLKFHLRDTNLYSFKFN